MSSDQKELCTLIRQLRIMALVHQDRLEANTLYDTIDWLYHFGELTPQQVENS